MDAPPRKRARMLSKACEMCKIKKSRCDSARPCSLCRQKGTTCEYREKGQPGLRPGYGKAMESRMAVLEDSMHRMSESLQQLQQQVQGGHAPLATQSTSARDMSSSSEHGSPGDETPDGSTASDMSIHASYNSTANMASAGRPGPLSVPPLWPPPPTPGGEWLSLSPAVADQAVSEILASMVSAKPMSAAAAMPAPESPTANPIPNNVPDLPGLPPREVLDDLIALFFDRIYPWAPLFHKPTFSRSVLSTSSTRTAGDEKLLLLHGITVLCFRFWTKPTPRPDARAAYIAASRDQVLLRTIDACSLVSTQALTLLALDAVGQGPGPRTWNIMAMLVAAARQLILATRTPNRPRDEANTPFVNDEGDDGDDDGRAGSADSAGSDEMRRRQNGPTGGAGTNNNNSVGDAGYDQSTPAIEAEEKRRLFWVIYSLDRFASIFHGQPGAIDTKTIRLLYPSSDDEWGRTSAAPEWFQGGTPDSSSHDDCSGGGGIHASYATLGSCGSNMAHATTGSLGNASSDHAGCAANLWHHYIDVLTLVDRSHRLLIQPVNVSVPAHCQEWQSSFRHLESVATAWFDNLPASVRKELPLPRQAPAANAPALAPPSPLPDTPPFSPVRAMVYASYLLVLVRMYMIASFPATTSAYLRPSLAARTRLRHVCHDLATLAAMYAPHELQTLGPLFVFIVWVGARSLVILWTRGAYGADELCSAVHKSACMLPPDLETLLTALRHMAVRWPCAQRYVDIIQMIIDTKNSPGGPPGLEIFNDPRRTSYVIQSRFTALANDRRASMSRAKSHDSSVSSRKEEKKENTATGQPQSQLQPHGHYAAFPQHGHHQAHSYQPLTMPYPYPTTFESHMLPFPQSMDCLDMPPLNLYDSYDLTETLGGTGTFGSEMDSEWL